MNENYYRFLQINHTVDWLSYFLNPQICISELASKIQYRLANIQACIMYETLHILYILLHIEGQTCEWCNNKQHIFWVEED